MPLITWIAVSVVSTQGFAQSPAPPPGDAPAPAPAVFNADRVLVAALQPENTESEPDAARLYEALVARMQQSNEVATMAVVPRFEPQGYDATQYIRGCPPGEYGGCALILGQRADADRVIGATLRRDPDEIEEGRSVLLMTVHIVDVHEAREVASFGLMIPEDREADTIDGVAGVFDEVVRGDYELQDLREKGMSPEEIEIVRARNERVAASLAALEEELGTAVRSEIVGWVQPRVTREDLLAYRDHEELPPWARAGMSEKEYLRFVNSGQDLDAWRKAGWGRFGRVVARASASATNGPWHQSYAGQVLLSDQNLQPVQSVQYLEVVNAASGGADLEVGFGVAPFADLTLAAVYRTGSTRYILDEDVQNQVSVPSREQKYAMSTWQLGVRGQFAPFPRWQARPTVAVGLGRWAGAGIPASERFERLEPPNALFLELMPGLEVDASDTVAFSLRILESVPLGGNLVRETSTGEPLMADPPGPSGQRGPGIGIQAGLVLRLGPLFERPPPRVPDFEDDEP